MNRRKEKNHLVTTTNKVIQQIKGKFLELYKPSVKKISAYVEICWLC